MISCKRATELISKSRDAKLTPYEKLKLRFHMDLCVFCRNFLTHLKLLRKASRSSSQDQLFSSETQHDSLTAEEKAKMLEKLKKRMKSS